MSLTRAELDTMRALVRSHNGLPKPPPRHALQAVWNLEPGQLPPAASELAVEVGVATLEESSCAPSLAQTPPCEVRRDAAPAAAQPASRDWRPDAVVHRLVELLMEMQRLSLHTPAQSDSLAKAADRELAA